MGMAKIEVMFKKKKVLLEPAPRVKIDRTICPRCKNKKEVPSHLVCGACWLLLPPKLRWAWTAAVANLTQWHFSARAILAWAEDKPLPPRERGVECPLCQARHIRPSIVSLADSLETILGKGLPKEVRQRAQMVAWQLRSFCPRCIVAKEIEAAEKKAAAASAPPPSLEPVRNSDG